ncbi:hypothetical protein DFH29DRAFT_805785 [Suillus ampliporus]|nr:hypothetical protein DFH29DRAFT_805785 [Suillus ampliporus]
MPGRAKSATKKRQDACKAHDDLMSKAVSAYCAELAKKLGIKHCGLWTIAKDFERMNFEATGNYIKLSHATLACLAAGKRSLAEMNAAKSWLSKEETKQVLAYIEEIGN